MKDANNITKKRKSSSLIPPTNPQPTLAPEKPKEKSPEKPQTTIEKPKEKPLISLPGFKKTNTSNDDATPIVTQKKKFTVHPTKVFTGKKHKF